MAEYDFHQLSWHDFEVLSRDLLQAEWGVRLQSFKAGKDGGIDLLREDDSNKLIVQCKHYVGTGLTGLMSVLKKEAANIAHLQPTRYVLVTSVPLSKVNKNTIIKLFGSDILKSEDILGQADVNNLLGLHPQIEKKHYKLWLASTAILERIVHSDIANRSQFAVSKVHGAIRRYVQTDTFLDALDLLESQRVVILTGPPGVGKTTMANMLLFAHLDKGYQPVVVHEIRDAERAFQEGTKQIFYYDDFLGATFLGEQGTLLSKNGDRELLDFMGMVRGSESSMFVLTTREHIMNQAVLKSEKFRHSDIGENKVVLALSDYTFEQRAKILYNHVYFSDLPSEYRRELLNSDFYLEVIRHKKFNPRLIDWLSSFNRVKKVPANRYRIFIRDLLKDPGDIWRHAYESELTNAAQSLLLALFSLNGGTSIPRLQEAFSALHTSRAKKYGFQRRANDFISSMRELEGSFTKQESNNTVRVLDPSVLDLLNTIIVECPDNAIDIISGSVAFHQIDRIWTLNHFDMTEAIDKALIENAELVADAINRTMLLDHVKEGEDGTKIYIGTRFEVRLANVMRIGKRLKKPVFIGLIERLNARLSEELENQSSYIDVTGAAEIIQALDSGDWPGQGELQHVRTEIKDHILESIHAGPTLRELRDACTGLDFNGPDKMEKDFFVQTFKKYLTDRFTDALAECSGSEHFQMLSDDLYFLQSTLHVDVEREMQLADFGQEEYEAREIPDYSETAAPWRNIPGDDPGGEAQVRSMFHSLGFDH